MLGEAAPRSDFEAIEIAPGLFRAVPKVDAYLALEARAQAAAALYEVLKLEHGRIRHKTKAEYFEEYPYAPDYYWREPINWCGACKAIADYEKVRGDELA